MKNKVLLTIDYELFGDGSGDVREHVLDPAERLMALGEKHGMPMTFFVQMAEFAAFRKYKNELKKDLGYDPAALIEKQLKKMISRGHDVQLHLHPQWVKAQYKNGRWLLDSNSTSIDKLFETQEEATHYLKESKGCLEELVATSQHNHVVCAYRAGAFCAQPGRFLINALKDSGILFDTSLVKGLYRERGQGAVDYRTCPTQNNWRVSEDVAVDDGNGDVIEVPIASQMQWRFQQATLGRLLAKFSNKIPKEKKTETLRGFGVSKNPMSVIRFLFQRVPTKFDFHNVNPSLLSRWIKKFDEPGSLFGGNVVVTIGHTKEHRVDSSVGSFLGKIKNAETVEGATFQGLSLKNEC